MSTPKQPKSPSENTDPTEDYSAPEFDRGSDEYDGFSDESMDPE